MTRTTLLGHGIGGPLDLPVSLAYFAVVGAMVILSIFAVLSVVWPHPRLQEGPRFLKGSHRGVRPWHPPQRLLGIIGAVSLVLTILTGISAPLSGVGTIGTRNIAPLLLWAVFWATLPLLGVLVGNVYTVINPWRTLSDWLGVGDREQPAFGARWGLWPAAALLVIFSWFELIYPGSSRPGVVGVAAALYTAFLLTMMGRFGRETTLASIDLFTPFHRLASAIAPWGRTADGKLMWRGWLRALPVVPRWPGLAAFVVVMIGIVVFDGLSYSTWWESQTGSWGSSLIVRSLLLLGTVGLTGAIYGGFSMLAARLASAGETTRAVAARYAHTLVPLALSYFFAHYFTLVIFEGQQLVSAVSDPLGLGWDLLGTRNHKINFFITPTGVWSVQIAALLAGSLATLTLGHDRALADFAGAAGIRVRVAHLTLTMLFAAAGLFLVAG
ncbi:MAG TPA: hypothetical protein VM470_05090 [Acidimicrobiia bacterium]|nr:hypothetical protein [Acidimicrobiia bacterium]